MRKMSYDKDLEIFGEIKSYTDCVDEIFTLIYMAEIAIQEIQSLEKRADYFPRGIWELPERDRRLLALESELFAWIGAFLSLNVKQIFDCHDEQAKMRLCDRADYFGRGEFLWNKWKSVNLDKTESDDDLL